MSVQIAAPPSVTPQGIVFLGRLVRLLAEVEELNRQLERVEGATQDALRQIARERYEELR